MRWLSPFVLSQVYSLVVCGLLFSPSSARSDPQSTALTVTNALHSTYRLKPRDTIQITVKNEPELYLKTRVSAQGKITFLYVGEMHVSGLTPKQVEKALKKKLMNGYLVNPVVSVFLQSGMYVKPQDRKHVDVGTIHARGEGVPPIYTEEREIMGASQYGNIEKTEKKHAAPVRKPKTTLSRLQKKTKNFNFIGINHPLGLGDKIKVKVDGEPDFNQEAKVSAQGTIDLPLLGEIFVVNLTVEAVEEVVRSKLLEGLLVDPTVFVTVTEYRPYYIYGEVKKAGGYPFLPNLTVRKAIALAEGFTAFADKEDILVVRDNDPLYREQKIDLDGFVFPGDVINVTESFW